VPSAVPVEQSGPEHGQPPDRSAPGHAHQTEVRRAAELRQTTEGRRSREPRRGGWTDTDADARWRGRVTVRGSGWPGQSKSDEKHQDEAPTIHLEDGTW
jgi:hypothetical protein